VYAPARAGLDQRELDLAYARSYEGQPFVRVRSDRPPEPGPTLGSNVCEVGAVLDTRTRTVLAFGALDNLIKGAAGQAIQAMNALLGLDPSAGLGGST
jgi:N-acetyl-gamma-glutamylphosphate reductase